ncbi:MAG TPA: response regulator [Geobacteraceae bacterium]|nr:response regulator [Geobacteraceae bacterium]
MKKVLIVNPSSDSLTRYRNILAREDFKIFTATSAEEALRVHRRKTADLLLTELNLPGGGGDELCRRIRREEDLRNVSIVIICRDVPEEIERAETCGANALLLRPFKLAQLDECVGSLLAVTTRQDCRVLVKVEVFDKQGKGALFGTTGNVSVSGLMIESDELLAVGDRIACRFLLPDTGMITVDGEVVRATRTSRVLHQYGVRFVSLDPGFRAEIEGFIAANTPVEE